MGFLNLMAKLGLDITPFQQQMARAEGVAEKSGSAMAATLKTKFLGAFTIGTAVAVGKTILDTASRVQDLSEQFDISTDAVQRIDFALKQGGLAFEDFGAAMDKFGAIRKKANEDDADSIKTLTQFGVTLDDIKSPLETNLDLILKLSAALKGITITPQQRADLRDIFGKSGGRLLRTMQGGGLGSDAPFQASPEQIGKVEGAGDWLSAAWQAVKNLGVKAGSVALNDPWKLLTPVAFLAASLSGSKKSGGASSSWTDAAPKGDGLHIFPQGEDFNDLFRGQAKVKTKAFVPDHYSVAADALANVGGYVGGAGGGGGPTDILRESLRVQVASKDYLRDIAQSNATF